jgi:hypothetical protein
VSWWLGDWWAYGEARYGERKAIVETEDWEGPAYQTCREAAVVSNAFPEMFRRRNNLTFSRHKDVAALPLDEADALLDWCEETPSGTPNSREPAAVWCGGASEHLSNEDGLHFGLEVRNMKLLSSDGRNWTRQLQETLRGV